MLQFSHRIFNFIETCVSQETLTVRSDNSGHKREIAVQQEDELDERPSRRPDKSYLSEVNSFSPTGSSTTFIVMIESQTSSSTVTKYSYT